MTGPRVLITCWPFVGHVHSQMAIAAELRERGSEVAFYSGEAARTTIEGEGYELHAFDHVDEQRVFEVIRRTELAADPGRRRAPADVRALREWLVETIPAQLADLRVAFERFRPDVVATDLSMLAPIVVLWETTRIPVALSSTLMGPLIPGPDAPPWGLGLPPPRTTAARLRARLLTAATNVAARGMRRRVDELRAEHGLPPMGCSVNEFTGRLPLYLVGSLPELDYGRRDLPASVQYVGPCVWHPPAEAGAVDWLEAIPADTPWVHVTESTLRHGDPFLLRAAAQGLAAAPLQAILTTGNQRSPDELRLGPIAPNVHLARWVNHDELLPRCAALVTTGGAATIMTALKAAVPLVIVPTTWDKPDNARRIVEAGVGIRLKPRDCSPAALRAAVEQLLDDRRYREVAERIATRLASAPGPARAAALVQALAPGGSKARTESRAATGGSAR